MQLSFSIIKSLRLYWKLAKQIIVEYLLKMLLLSNNIRYKFHKYNEMSLDQTIYV